MVKKWAGLALYCRFGVGVLARLDAGCWAKGRGHSALGREKRGGSARDDRAFGGLGYNSHVQN